MNAKSLSDRESRLKDVWNENTKEAVLHSIIKFDLTTQDTEYSFINFF